MEQLQELPFKGQKALFRRLEELAKIVNLNKKERMEYDECLKVYRDNQNTWNYAIEKGYQEGMEKGFADGQAKGKEAGMAEGKAEGKAEGIYDVARNLKTTGIDIATIMNCTGLDAETIAKL